jgi:hypothetical protein
MPLTTGKTWSGNTAFGPSGGTATGYATRDSSGNYSNFVGTDGKALSGYSGSGGRITYVGGSSAPSQQSSVKAGSGSVVPKPPATKVVGAAPPAASPYKTRSLVDHSPKIAAAVKITGIRGGTPLGVGGYGAGDYRTKHHYDRVPYTATTKTTTDRVPRGSGGDTYGPITGGEDGR